MLLEPILRIATASPIATTSRMMITSDRSTAFGGRGCRFPLSRGAQCGKARRRGSPYCPAHHAVCYIPRGSKAEAARLHLIAFTAAFFSRRPPTEPNGHG